MSNLKYRYQLMLSNRDSNYKDNRDKKVGDSEALQTSAYYA